MSLTVLA